MLAVRIASTGFKDLLYFKYMLLNVYNNEILYSGTYVETPSARCLYYWFEQAYLDK